MSGLIEPHSFWERTYRYRLSKEPASGYERCRCGTLLPVDIPCFRFDDLPETLRAWLGRQEFCSVRCARAVMLELRELLEVSVAPAVLSDFEEVSSGVKALFVLTENAGGA